MGCLLQVAQEQAQQKEEIEEEAEEEFTQLTQIGLEPHGCSSAELTQGSQMLLPSASQTAELNTWGLPADVYVDPPSVASDITHICLCSCIGGFTWASKRCGLKTQFFAEIDEVCR